MRPVTRSLFLGGRFFHLLSSIFHASAEATLTLDELRAHIAARGATFNDREYDVDGGLVDWEAAAADRLVTPGDAVLIAGCGSGREIFAYLERGCRVTGIDPAPRALALARRLLDERGLTAELIEGYFDAVEIPGRFDALLIGWGVYQQIPESARRVQTLKRFAAQLKPGGRVCVSYDRLPRPRPIVIRIARLVGAVARSDWRLEQGDIVEWRHHGGAPFFSYYHAFVPAEIEREASAAGLRIVYRQDPPDLPFYILEAGRA